MKIKKTISAGLKFTIAILLCEGIGISSGLLAGSNNSFWFENLVKPSWNPPSYLFGPVWTALYLLMGISLALIWKHNATEQIKRKAYLVFAIQLFLNFWWSLLFFYFQSSFLALIDIVLMVLFILLTMFRFNAFSKPASWLLIPYLLWVSFATLLNFSIWYLNY
jgi:tryptophan-rich sensory protein